ncbi:MAG: hypothetical protein R3272_04025 [Candidatus Promineifilaceae bacterium]|nr:hypothetical protein [Candidatus Promineifilaceae bacterium]
MNRSQRRFWLGLLGGLGVGLLFFCPLVAAYVWQTQRNGRAVLPVEEGPATPLVLPTPLATAAPADAAADVAPGPTPTLSFVSPDEWGGPQGRLVFTCFIAGTDEICTMDADGGEIVRLTNGERTDFYPEWSADGELITWSSNRSGEFYIYLMEESGANVAQLSPLLGSHYAPHVSPDGSQILFANAIDGVQSIWVMDADGGNARPLTDDEANDIDPVWSPDGSQIAFASDRGARTAHWIMNADGSEMRMLPDDVANHGGRSSWSPDGRWLAFYAGPRDNRDIYLIATDGSGATRRLTNGGGNLAPDFSPRGDWIVFTSYREGDDAEIFIMRPDGSDVRQLTFNERPDWQPRWGPE